MTVDERKEVARVLLELNDGEESAPHRATNFSEAKAYVFDNYGELLRRLAGEEHGVREAKASDPDLPAAMDKVFTKHRELFRRLAE